MANNLPANQNMSLAQYMKSDAIKNRLNEILGKNAPAFASTVISLCNANKQLQECNPKTIVGSAMLAATLNLPVTPSLGQAYIVPYKGQAQFQLGTKGLLQLALRSGQYQNLHVGEVYEGQIRNIDPLTGEIERGEKISDKVVGYVAYMKLVNGFEKMLYMTAEDMRSFAKKYSPSYAYDLRSGRNSSVWSTNFDAMAKKTMLKKLLREYGILSIDQQSTDLATAIQADQAVVDEGKFAYVDSVDDDGTVQSRDQMYLPEEQPEFDTETGEVKEPLTLEAES